MTASEPTPPALPDLPTAPAADAKPAELIVTVPAGAKLFVDDQPSTQTAAERRFMTPDLPPGRTFYYVLRLEAERDGRAWSQSRRVEVTAGAEVRVTFEPQKDNLTEE